MRVVFFGTDIFAQNILAFLLENKVDIVAVVTRADKPKGRSGEPSPPPVKDYLDQIHFSKPIYQPIKASSEDFISQMREHAPDLFVVVSYGQIIKQNLLDLPRFTAINVHPSLLPKYRGPSPIQSAVLQGETEVGVTIMEMVLALDAGPILKVVKTNLTPDMSFGDLEEKLCTLAQKPLLEVIHAFAKGEHITKIPQNEDEATFTKKIRTEDSWIDWNQKASEVHNFIRGMNPRPGARCFVAGAGDKKIIKILRSKVVDYAPVKAGETATYHLKEGWIVGCKEGALQILEVQPEGKKKMNITDFINGFPFPILL